MTIDKLLIANRGEIAVRIMRAAAELGIETVGVYSKDDERCLHVRRADNSIDLGDSGPAAYLDIQRIVSIARDSSCDAVHPGYGFLSENADFARACGKAGITFVGPSPETLQVLGDKVAARKLAQEQGVPILAGTARASTLDDAKAFFSSLGPEAAIMIKAVAGGGGRGMRVVTDIDEVESAFRRCQSEAAKAFGREELFVEQLLRKPRHIEVQIVGDGHRAIDLGERDCSVQRRHQKLIEIAPAPKLGPETRRTITDGALRIAQALQYVGVGTFEFLIAENGECSFIEANPRLQVEHTVTEEVTGVDLVQTQLAIAGSSSLESLGLENGRPTSGQALQLRINMERMNPDGTVHPTGGTLSAFEIPSGPGVRTDTAGYAGYTPAGSFDSLLAKVIVHSAAGSFDGLVRKARRALRELRIEGVETNQSFLGTLLDSPHFAEGNLHTTLIEDNIAELVTGDAVETLFFNGSAQSGERVGARVDPDDPLAVLAHGKSGTANPDEVTAHGDGVICAPLQGTVISVEVSQGMTVAAGQGLAILEAMKMEHVVEATSGGTVVQVHIAPGDTVLEGHVLLEIEVADQSDNVTDEGTAIDLDRIRPDLEESRQRHAAGHDAARPQAVARRRKTGHRTTRENIADLCDDGSFVEYGALTLAAQHRRRSTEELIEKTPADGLVAGIGTINGELFDQDAARCSVLSYDYTVLAGTQGLQNHRKKDRMFELAAERQLPVVLFAEGGGGRPGDTDSYGVTGLDCLAFQLFAELNGRVPLVGITTGRCFAGNAALLGCCDVVIATEGSNIGMGGPAMVEGGGLGVFRPEEIGPMSVQVANGVVDLPVADEAAAVAVAKQYLSYFQGDLESWECPDQRLLRHAIPENRLRIYDVRNVIETMADTGSVLELRRAFGRGMVTVLARIEGRAVGIVANNPTHLAGAIDSDGADKAARFMQLCDAFGLPLVFLCDTPGIMVGPEVEKTALVRHAARMFVTGASIKVPFCTIVLRKGYGLGAQAMAGGSFKAPYFTVAWPTGEFGGMGLEGAVKLGFRNELAAIEDSAERKQTFKQMVDRMYQVGKAVNIASHFEIDEVIDPMDSRRWILSAIPSERSRKRGRQRQIDTW